MINDGGQAFPTELKIDEHGATGGDSGMTLRDYFAAHAPKVPLHARNALHRIYFRRTEGDIDIATEAAKAQAHWSYLYADEMIKQRGF
jgi:hypothetical protein